MRLFPKEPLPFSAFLEWTYLFFGSTLTAVGIYFFEFLNHFTTGGVSGLAMILSVWFPRLSAPTVMLLINLLLFFLGFLLLGKRFGKRTLFCSASISAETLLLESLVPRTSPLTDQPMLEVAFMILLPSLGCAIVFYFGGSTGGTDIVAMIIKKYSDFPISRALLVSDLAIVSLLFFVFGLETWLFSMLGFLCRIVLLDGILRHINTSKLCTVILSPAHAPEIRRFITHVLQKSATYSDFFVGAWQMDARCVLLTALTKRQAIRLKKYASTVDPSCFLVISNTSEVIGEGFRKML